MSLFLKKLFFPWILKRVRSFNGDELNQLLNAIVHRHRELFPDWELIALSLPCREEDGREKILTDAFAMLTHTLATK